MLLADGGYADGPGAARRRVVAMLLIRVEASSIALDPPGIERTLATAPSVRQSPIFWSLFNGFRDRRRRNFL